MQKWLMKNRNRLTAATGILIPILIEINGGILISRYVKSIKARRSKDQCKNG